MKQGLMLLLAVCTLAAAMVPRDRRAVNSEEEEEMLKIETTTINSHETCAPTTPCQWIMYNSFTHDDMIIMNTYCECSKGQECSFSWEDSSTHADVYHCSVPKEPSQPSNNS